MVAISAEDISTEAADRFWGRVKIGTQHECWPWLAARDRKGYGAFNLTNKITRKSHRIAYALANGLTPDNRFVCHRCDNPPCCNPAHFFLGTAKDNQQDMASKGRGTLGDKNVTRMHPEKIHRGDMHYSRRTPEKMVRGESHGMATLTEDDVRAIRSEYAAGSTNGQLADKYGVSCATIYRTVSRKNWKHIP